MVIVDSFDATLSYIVGLECSLEVLMDRPTIDGARAEIPLHGGWEYVSKFNLGVLDGQGLVKQETCAF